VRGKFHDAQLFAAKGLKHPKLAEETEEAKLIKLSDIDKLT
jgi:hypothetical protein